MGTNNNDVFSAFIKQTYGSIENAKMADKIADNKLQEQKLLQDEFHKKATIEMCKDQSIIKAMNLPTKLPTQNIDNKTESHPHFENYDHSLEMDRKTLLRNKYLNEKYKNNPEDKPSEIDFQQPQKGNVGDVEDMFNNIFKED